MPKPLSDVWPSAPQPGREQFPLQKREAYPTVYTYLGIALQGPEHLHEKIALNRKAIELDKD